MSCSLRNFNLLLVLSAVLGAGCSSSAPGGDGDGGQACTLTYECDRGQICVSGQCQAVDVGTTEDGGVAVDDGGPALDGDTPDVDGGTTADAAPPQTSFGPDKYRRCFDDLECAVFGGNCLTELTLSRPLGDGTEKIAVAAIDPSFATGQGVCTLACTSDPRVCDSMVVDGPGGQTATSSCQVVYAGSSPYPAVPPAFPFDTTLDTIAMERGVSFASVCRPPFQFSAAHSNMFCEACTQDDQCGPDATCFLEHAASTPASGSCVESCTDSTQCVFGFTCAALPGSASAATYCLPVEGTCGRCRDGDGDLRGVGRCGALAEPNTAVDCDDSNPVAYYDADDPNHAFPGVCGDSDVNCNGLSDESEQLGGEQHCGSCNDQCVAVVGAIDNAVRDCVERPAGYACIADCDPGFADCDGNVENGCEEFLGADQIWAEDADGDGRGSYNNYVYVCTGSAPLDWVQNRLDCDDADATVFGGDAVLAAAAELCDGLDNNCNGLLDDPGMVTGVGTVCDTGLDGVCADGQLACNSTLGSGSLECVGDRDPALQILAAEQCDGQDNNCNGVIDENVDYVADTGMDPSCVPEGPDGAEIFGICADGAYACVADAPGSAGWSCLPKVAELADPIDGGGIDQNCDGSDGDQSIAIFVRPAGGGSLDGDDANNGSAQAPVATLKEAIFKACNLGDANPANRLPRWNAPCRDIFVEAATFASAEALQIPRWDARSSTNTFNYCANLPFTYPGAPTTCDNEAVYPRIGPPVRIYGGFEAALDCNIATCALKWTRGNGLSELVRQPPPAAGTGPGTYPFGKEIIAITAGPIIGGDYVRMSVLLDQMRIVVEAPNTAALVQGEHAPAQIGLKCPYPFGPEPTESTGCGLVVMNKVEIVVEEAARGGEGIAGDDAIPSFFAKGADGCLPGESCGIPAFYFSDWAPVLWMQYRENNGTAYLPQGRSDSGVVDNTRGIGDGCTRGTGAGGYAGGVRSAYDPEFQAGVCAGDSECFDGAKCLYNADYDQNECKAPTVVSVRPDGTNGENALPSLGYGVSALAYEKSLNHGTTAFSMQTRLAGRGMDGGGGLAGGDGSSSYSAYDSSFGAHEFLFAHLVSVAPEDGLTGGGGGGGGGCITGNGVEYNPNSGVTTNYSYRCGLADDPEGRGGAGGGGGCGGLSGETGGNGGHAIGMVLTGSLGRLVIDPYLSGTEEFSVSVGRGGQGGRGGAGGKGAPGGYGGSPAAGITSAYHRGGNGGDGGGGAGGNGGAGGVSIPVIRYCRAGTKGYPVYPNPGAWRLGDPPPTAVLGTKADGCWFTMPPKLLASPVLFATSAGGGAGGAGGPGGDKTPKAPSLEHPENMPGTYRVVGADFPGGNTSAKGEDGTTGPTGFSQVLVWEGP